MKNIKNFTFCSSFLTSSSFSFLTRFIFNISAWMKNQQFSIGVNKRDNLIRNLRKKTKLNLMHDKVENFFFLLMVYTFSYVSFTHTQFVINSKEIRFHHVISWSKEKFDYALKQQSMMARIWLDEMKSAKDIQTRVVRERRNLKLRSQCLSCFLKNIKFNFKVTLWHHIGRDDKFRQIFTS